MRMTHRLPTQYNTANLLKDVPFSVYTHVRVLLKYESFNSKPREFVFTDQYGRTNESAVPLVDSTNLSLFSHSCRNVDQFLRHFCDLLFTTIALSSSLVLGGHFLDQRILNRPNRPGDGVYLTQ